jgi:predicted amidohydrolase
MSLLNFTLIQTDLHWEDKKANLDMLEEKIYGIKERTEIIVLPEMFNTGFSMNCEQLAEKMNGPTVEWMKRISKDKKNIITGSAIIEEEGKYYNRLIWMLPIGVMGCYNKRHLFAYANEDKNFTAGNNRFIASVKGWKINIQICYDLRFPVWARQQISSAEAEFDVLIYIANWPERRSLAWKSLLQARAIENQCYVIGVNRVGKDGNEIYYSGDSMVIDPMGEILFQKANEEYVHTITLSKDHLKEVRAKFPFWKEADKFKIVNE